MLDPLTLFLIVFLSTLLLTILALLALGRYEGTLSVIHWPRALVYACIGSAGVGMLGVVVVSLVAWVAGSGGRG